MLNSTMHVGQPYSLVDLYAFVEDAIALDEDDLESDGVSQSRWKRNVRNHLQYRASRGDLHRTSRGEYLVPVGGSSPPLNVIGRLNSARHVHERVLDALAEWLLARPADAAMPVKPLDVRLAPPLPRLVRFYAYLATDHPAERSAGDYRIQVIVPGQRPGTRAHFDRGDGAMVVLLGYTPDFEVFVLWDAAVHDAGQGIPFSKGVQVHAATVFHAAAVGRSTQERLVRSSGRPFRETVIAARSRSLVQALVDRQRLSMRALLEAP
ncbi:MAG: hypothetical protein KF809_14265 [Chloroflexi bacterium]|nr:hypothetical protein [Chloroflexota bacterium]